MVSKVRLLEIWNYYTRRDPSFDDEDRFRVMRNRMPRLMNSEKLRSIQIALGDDSFPVQHIIFDMDEQEFEELISVSTPMGRRKEIVNKNRYIGRCK